MKTQKTEKQLLEDFALLLQELSNYCMPFGKFGPDRFPPRGVPLIDLPYEYLAFFKSKGFPNGKLGKLMEFVYYAKLDGADPPLFDDLRKANGGRTSLRPSKSKPNYTFGE